MGRNPYHPLFLGSASGQHLLWLPELPVLPQRLQGSHNYCILFFFTSPILPVLTPVSQSWPSTAEALCCALWWGGWNRPEPAASGMRRPCFSSQSPSCRRPGTHARHNSRPDQKGVKIKTCGATAGDSFRNASLLCCSSPAADLHRLCGGICLFIQGKAAVLQKWGMAIRQPSDSARNKMQILGAPELYVYYLLTHSRCSSERMEDDPCTGRMGLLGAEWGLLQGWK